MSIAAKGVDLSHHNGVVDFAALSKSVSFVMKLTKDSKNWKKL